MVFAGLICAERRTLAPANTTSPLRRPCGADAGLAREDAAMSTRNGIGTIVRWGLLETFGGVFCGHRGGMPMRRTWLVAISGSLVMTAATLLTPGQGYAGDTHAAINCEYSSLCAEVADPGAVFGSGYVGHDEPSLAFYSDVPGAGNHMTYSFRLPRDPSSANPNTPGKSYQFQLNGSFRLGMALCATQSYPEQVSTCTPDSDSNIVDLAVHPGTAILELQFFPPGWIPWPTWAVAVGAGGCDATKWCAAM